MAASYAMSSCRSLQALPIELLLEISDYFTDFSSLHGLFTFLTGHHRGFDFIQTYQTHIFATAIRPKREDELTRLVTTVMTLRNDAMTKEKLSRKGYKVRNFVCKYLRSPDIERAGEPHYLQWFSDPVAAIRDIWQISEDIERLVGVFAETCIVGPSELRTRRSPSPTELHRSRRAFWRFQLCYDMFYPDTDWPRHTGDKLKDFMQEFMQTLCPWEVDEFEAVRFHLRCAINRLQYSARKDPSRLKSQPALLQRLLNDPEYWRQDQESPFDHLLIVGLPNNQPSLRLNSGRRSHNGAANAVNISGGPPLISLKLLGWGMWDRERMIMRGLSTVSGPGEIIRECEEAQSIHLNCWAAEACQNDVELEEEKLLDFRSALVRRTRGKKTASSRGWGNLSVSH